MSSLDAAAVPGAGWDEAQCAAALAQLEQLQAQLDSLRPVIPRIVEPFHRTPNPSTFKLFAQGVLSSQHAVKGLHDSWKRPEIQSTFEHVRKSVGVDADLAPSSSIPSSGWVEREKRERHSTTGTEKESTEENGAILTDEDITAIIEDFKTRIPDIKLDAQEDNSIISTTFVAGANKLNFNVRIEREADGRHKLTAECPGTKEPWLSISRCIASRPQPNDLKYLLDMIAAYKTVKALSCAKCSKLFDSTMSTPTARRSRSVANNDEPSETEWRAFHEGCLE